MRRDIKFNSEGAELSGWLYLPDSPQPWPLVVMANGYSTTRRMTADKYAEVFQEAGLAVLLFDHRGFGESGGEPRLQVNTWIQARGYRDAISTGLQMEGIDPDRIAIWGDSLSAGIGIAVTAVDERVSALVVQVPSIGSTRPSEDSDGTLFHTLRETLLVGEVEASDDEVEGPMPVVSDDQLRRPSALKPLTAYRWFIEYGGRFQSGWVNNVTRARPHTPVPWEPGLCAPYIKCPSLFEVSPHDEMPHSNPAVTRHTYERLSGPKEWVEIEGGHFGIMYYPSPEFEMASTAQAQFLKKYLLGSGDRE